MADPIQIWTPIVQEDTSSIANAIAGAGDSLGRGLAGLAERLEKRKEEQKREQINAKSADTLFKANPELQKALGMDEHAFLGLPRAERIAAVAGGISHLTLQQANAKAMREQEEYARQATSAAALQRAAGTTAQRNLERYYEGDEGYTGLPAFDEAMFQNPGMVNAPNFNEFARTVQGARDSGSLFKPDELGKIRPTEYPGVGFVPTTKGGGQIVYDPTTPNRPSGPRPGDEGTIEIPDPDDPVYGPRIRIPVSVARKEFPHLLKSIDKGKPAPAEDAAAAKELQQANEAIAAGVDRRKVAAKYKERTGKDLP